VAGADLRYDLTITLAEAVSGVNREIHFPALVRCATCDGSGAEPGSEPERCPECNGTGVSIPPGIESGQRIALEGQGEAGPRGGPNGDLYVLVTVREDPDLVRRGTELYVEVPVTFAQAALGASVSVRTVEGSEDVAIPAGTQSGHEIRLRGRGMPRLRGSGRGDLHVIATVVVPSKLSRRERELLRELGEVSGPAVLPKSGPSLGDRLRDLFS
jgi:molecular chaperone DnaJ